MKKFKQLLTITFALCISMSVNMMAQGQPEAPEKEKITKEEREALRDQHRAEIAAIEADTKLSPEEKETLIKERRRAWAMEMRKGKRGEYRGGSKKGRGKAKFDERRKAYIAELEKQFEAIENNPDLTPEQKEDAKAKLKQEERAKHKARHGERRKGPGAEKMKEERKAAKEILKGELDAIDADPNLTPEQKESAKTKLIEERKGNWTQKREEWLKSHPKGERPEHGQAAKGKGKGKAKRKMKARKLNERIDSGLDDAEKAKVLERLDKIDEKLDKQKEKGKISAASYEKRKAEIIALRNKL